jgi:hypothetical protein
MDPHLQLTMKGFRPFQVPDWKSRIDSKRGFDFNQKSLLWIAFCQDLNNVADVRRNGLLIERSGRHMQALGQVEAYEPARPAAPCAKRHP